MRTGKPTGPTTAASGGTNAGGAGVSSDGGEAGLTLFARYAYPPNALGYCGPEGEASLLAAAARGERPGELRPLTAHFEGARPYLEIIAAHNRIADPLDRRVVEAYWVGNDLLWHLPADALVETLEAAFSGPLVDSLDEALAAAARGGIAHHSFHVFAVYPWLRLLRAGRRQPALGVLDRCRIRWGRVEEVVPGAVSVRTEPLSFEASTLAFGPECIEQARCRPGAGSGGPHLQAGAMVALHWDWVCDVLSTDSVRWLRDCTRRNLDAVNRASPAS